MAQPCLPPGDADPLAELDGLRLLVVDDEELLLIALGSLLRAAGAVVLSAPDTAVALSYLFTNSVDLVLTDFHLPDRTGVWLAEWIAAHLPALPVVLMSASVPPSGTILPASVKHFVRKPFDTGTLVELLIHTARRGA
ncbi:MAG TPA: response regulator [Longimicrobium sp.]